MGTLLKFIGGIVLLIIVIAALSGGSSTKKATDLKTSPDATATPSSSAPASSATAVTPDPHASASLTCDYLLSPGISAPNHFVGGGDLRNSGNIGVIVKVTARWQRLGQAPARIAKSYRVRRGQTRTVNFSVPATIEDISAHQSANAKCSTHATVAGTFGKAA